MKVLITGVHGFIGSSLGRYAAVRKHTVLGIGRTSQAPAGLAAGYKSLDAQSADLAPTIEAFIPDVVVHCAGSASVRGSFEDPAVDFRASAWSLLNLLDGVRRSSVRPLIVFPSSAAVYGNPDELPIAENAPMAPISPYGFHKLAAETVAASYARCFALKICVCRIFSVFGPAQRRLLVWELFQQVSSSSPTVKLTGTGDETRDYLHISDVAAAIFQLASALQNAEPVLEPWVFNIASGNEIPISELAALMGRLSGAEKPVVPRGSASLGDPQQWRADIARLRQTLPDWQPAPLELRLAETLREWRGEI